MSETNPLGGANRFQVNFLSEYTEEALIAEMRRISSLLEPGQPLTKLAYERMNPKASYTTIRRRFSGWNEAIFRAGLGERRKKGLSHKQRSQLAKAMSRDDVLAELKRVHSLVDTPWLTTDDFNQLASIGEGAIRKHFGTFRDGLIAAGIESHRLARRPLTDGECFANLATVWTHHGRVPSYREMFNPPSTIQGKTYITRWGTWRGALSSFVGWANEDQVLCVAIALDNEQKALSIGLKRLPREEADQREVRPSLRFRVFQRDRFRCLTCGRSPATNLDVQLHADHILAVANGGKTVIENLQTLCQGCNLGKGKMLL